MKRRIVHVCDGWEPFNGAANIARLVAREQERRGDEPVFRRFASWRELRGADEVWTHCGWKPCLWWAVFAATAFRAHGAKRPTVRWMTEACYDPVRLRYHAWKKVLAGPFERFFLRRCDALVATCPEEAAWNRAYLGAACPEVETEDIARFFALGRAPARTVRAPADGPLRVLYLGRRHPLKGLGLLERAVAACNAEKPGRVELHAVSGAQGRELEEAWTWCDLLCLPTLSDNFGLVVAEALERGVAVVTTDGAPAWAPFASPAEPDPSAARPRLVYLRGYRDGGDFRRVELLKAAIQNVCGARDSRRNGTNKDGPTGLVSWKATGSREIML